MVVPTVCKSWFGNPDSPTESTSTPVEVEDDANPGVNFLRPHEAEKLLGHEFNSTAGTGITALARLKALGNGWDINVVKRLLAYITPPGTVENSDWCLQFSTGDKVKVWCDQSDPPAWNLGVVQSVSKAANSLKVVYPVQAGRPDLQHSLHELNDGNVQPREGCQQTPAMPTDLDLNSVLTQVAREGSSRKPGHKVKVKPDRWSGTHGSEARSNKPYLNFKQLKWSEYHKTNPAKGHIGHTTVKAFTKQIDAEWEQLVTKSTDLHKRAKQLDAAARSTGHSTACSKCGRPSTDFKNMNSFHSHQSRCSGPTVATAALALEHALATPETTYRIDCEQTGSEWDSCHQGQEAPNSTELLTGQLPIAGRDIHTQFVLNDGSTLHQVTENASRYQHISDWGRATRRITTDVEPAGAWGRPRVHGAGPEPTPGTTKWS